MHRRALFLASARGQRFMMVNEPAGRPVGGLLYVHPFAEEMNRSRRMAALASRAFAERGWLVAQIDLAGCGDSAGDFGAADWSAWLQDVSLGWQWLNDACHGAPVALWTLRAGSLLAADWLQRAGAEHPLLLWQPVVDGAQHLTQFLRLKAANEMLNESESKTVIAQLRSALKGGSAVEVSGYVLHPELASGLESARLRLSETYRRPVVLLEVTSQPRRELSPALAALVAKWHGTGVPVKGEVVQGPPFWHTPEIETAPSLVDSSLASLNDFL